MLTLKKENKWEKWCLWSRKSIFMISEFPLQNFSHALRKQQNAMRLISETGLSKELSIWYQTYKPNMGRSLPGWAAARWPKRRLLPRVRDRVGQSSVCVPFATQRWSFRWVWGVNLRKIFANCPPICVFRQSPPPRFLCNTYPRQTDRGGGWRCGEAQRWGSRRKGEYKRCRLFGNLVNLGRLYIRVNCLVEDDVLLRLLQAVPVSKMGWATMYEWLWVVRCHSSLFSCS